jgi:hypothetical protein
MSMVALLDLASIPDPPYRYSTLSPYRSSVNLTLAMKTLNLGSRWCLLAMTRSYLQTQWHLQSQYLATNICISFLPPYKGIWVLARRGARGGFLARRDTPYFFVEWSHLRWEYHFPWSQIGPNPSWIEHPIYDMSQDGCVPVSDVAFWPISYGQWLISLHVRQPLIGNELLSFLLIKLMVWPWWH